MTRHDTLKWLPAAFVLVSLLALAPGAPVAWAGEPLEVSVHAGGDAVTWAPAEAGEFLLRISMPSGKVVERRGSGSLRIDGRAVPGRAWADGVYVWELISMTAGAAGEQRLPATGSFRVSGASFHLPADRPEAEAEPRPRATEDQTVPDDLIVDGKACLGLGCATGESFGAEAARLKQANLALRFEDTSTVTNIPTRDWQITVNEPGTTGVDKFAIQDLTAGTTPVTVRGGAPSNSLYVDVAGNLGAGTATPAADLHLSGAAAQSIRLEKTGAPARTWDVAADNTSFRVVDVTNASAVPVQVAAGAPTNSLAVTAAGRVGVGTANPPAILAVVGSAPFDAVMRVQNQSNPGYSGIEFIDSSGNPRFFFGVNNSTVPITTRLNSFAPPNQETPFLLMNDSVERIRIEKDGDIGFSCNSVAADFVIASGNGCANPSSSINAGGVQFTAASSRTFKENLAPLGVSGLLDKVAAIGVYQYDFIDGPKDQIGLIAEDFHQVFERGDEKYIDGGEVQLALWLAVQELTARNRQLAAENDRLNQRLERIEQMLVK